MTFTRITSDTSTPDSPTARGTRAGRGSRRSRQPAAALTLCAFVAAPLAVGARVSAPTAVAAPPSAASAGSTASAGPAGSAGSAAEGSPAASGSQATDPVSPVSASSGDGQRPAPATGATGATGAGGGALHAGGSGAVAAAVGRGNPKSVGYLTTPPSKWDPCTTIRYRVNLAGAPKGAAADVDTAIARIAAASGLRFQKVGTTSVVPGTKGKDVLDDYPSGTQLVIAFARPNDPTKARRSAYLTGSADTVGVGGAFYDLDTARAGKRSWHRIVQGYVVLDRTKSIPSGFGAGNTTGLIGTWGQVLMHELGHVVGLDHPKISDPTQIMYPATTRKPAVWGAGDLVGLSTVGKSSGCFSSAGGAMTALTVPTPQKQPNDAGVKVLPRSGH